MKGISLFIFYFFFNVTVYHNIIADGFIPSFHPENTSNFNAEAKISLAKLKRLKTNVISILFISWACIICSPNIGMAVPIDDIQEQYSWRLQNGQVQISDPLTVFPQRTMFNPKLLGSGGGGAVFAMQQQGNDKEIAVKISWVGSAESVARECKILNLLQEKNTRNVEICLGQESYPFDHRRIMIALEPVVHDATASIVEMDASKQADCVRSIMKTLVDMLAANVVTTDVQMLIDKQNGDVSSCMCILNGLGSMRHKAFSQHQITHF